MDGQLPSTSYDRRDATFPATPLRAERISLNRPERVFRVRIEPVTETPQPSEEASSSSKRSGAGAESSRAAVPSYPSVELLPVHLQRRLHLDHSIPSSTSRADLPIAVSSGPLPAGLEAAAPSEADRQRAWESGHPDYMGRDAFDNIQKALDQAMN